MPDTHPWPTELRLRKDKASVGISFDDGTHFDLPAEMLRVLSPSAEVQGHSAAERKTVPGKRNVRISALEPVGNYAVRIRFDDGHDTGLFSWAYLSELGRRGGEMFDAYLRELAAKGLSRER
jgi:DUF971 family protein